MSETYKACPICEARNHRNAALCSTCGANIAEVKPRESPSADTGRGAAYDYRLGEADLAEASLSDRGRILSAILLGLIIVAAGAGAVAWLAPRLFDSQASQPASPTATAPFVLGPTVTPGEPTATFTPSPIPSPTPSPSPSPAPCMQTVATGDSLIGILARCGYRNLDILPTVMALNGIEDESRIQIGQEIIVPRPSPTPDPAATAPPATETSEGGAESAALEIDAIQRLAFDPFAPTLTPTLLPGLMWHIVQPEENMITIAFLHNMDAKAFSDLNPEINFPLCDFSARYGGPECTVQLRQRQYVRVPAPTATATPIPTAGSQTPTPSPTATFNAPIAQSPADEAIFSALEQVTLRWLGTGRLAADEVYRIALRNLDTEAAFSADTRELFFIIPPSWQAQAAQTQRYEWQVSVVNTDSDAVSYVTERRVFLWQGVDG